MGPVEDPKLIHMVMIAHFWPTNLHPDDEGRVSNLQFTISQHKVDKSQFKIRNNDFKTKMDNLDNIQEVDVSIK